MSGGRRLKTAFVRCQTHKQPGGFGQERRCLSIAGCQPNTERTTMSVKTLKSWVLVSIAAVTVGVAAASAAGALAESVTGITTDATVRTTGHHSLSATGGVEATVATLTLPAGNWILHSD